MIESTTEISGMLTSRGLESREKAKKEEEERRKSEAAEREKRIEREEEARRKDEEARAKVQRDIRAVKEEQGGCLDVDAIADFKVATPK